MTTDESPRVLWIDEDQSQLSAVAWIIAKCGAVIERALSIPDAERLLAAREPSLILLDMVVRGREVTARDPYSGLALWRSFDDTRKGKTVMLSIVPYDRIIEHEAIPKDRYFWKMELEKHLDELESIIRTYASAGGPDPASEARARLEYRGSGPGWREECFVRLQHASHVEGSNIAEAVSKKLGDAVYATAMACDADRRRELILIIREAVAQFPELAQSAQVSASERGGVAADEQAGADAAQVKQASRAGASGDERKVVGESPPAPGSGVLTNGPGDLLAQQELRRGEPPEQAIPNIRAIARSKIFVSYSHKDARVLAELKTMLGPAIRKGIVQLWDDTMIKPGAKWRDQIKAGLAAARVAVLLVSPEFLDSDFIAKNELPPLLKAAQDEGVTVVWVCLSSCLYKQTEVEQYQAAHDVGHPLDSLRKAERKATLKDICDRLLQTGASS